ncbi:MAG: hypothetical protein ABIJ09_21825 [Pseudomonadota bacterium]
MRYQQHALFLLPSLLLGCGLEDAFTPITTGQHFVVQAASSDEDCLTCLSELTEPILGHQTPSELRTRVISVELMRSPFDLDPHLVLAYDPPLEVDLTQNASFVDVDTGSIPPGLYPLMRVTLASAQFTVDATAHVPGSGPQPGTLSVDYALSKYDDEILGARTQGDYEAEFVGGEMSFPSSSNQPVAYPPPYPGATVDTAGGLYRVTFPSPNPIEISHSAPTSVDVEVTFFIQDAFAWLERDGDDNQADVFDLSMSPTSAELPVSLGISGFELAVK